MNPSKRNLFSGSFIWIQILFLFLGLDVEIIFKFFFGASGLVGEVF